MSACTALYEKKDMTVEWMDAVWLIYFRFS
jgi:hypothetical protein